MLWRRIVIPPDNAVVFGFDESLTGAQVIRTRSMNSSPVEHSSRASVTLSMSSGLVSFPRSPDTREGLDVPEWLAFVRTPDLMLDAMGRVYVRGGQDAAIAVLDAEGGFVRTIGRKGEGPGEFVAIGGMGFVGDTLWLQNWPMLHTSFFDSAGTHLKTEADRGIPSTGPCLWRTLVPLAGGRGLYIPASGTHSEARVRIPAMPTTDSGKPIADSRPCRSPWRSGGP